MCSSDPTGKHKLDFWKSEEFSKLALVAHYALHSQVPKEAYESCLLTHIHQLVFSKELHIDGWTQHHNELLQNLWKHAILLKSLYGFTSLQVSLHMVEELERHSTLGNYWCFVYEWLVRFYKQQH